MRPRTHLLSLLLAAFFLTGPVFGQHVYTDSYPKNEAVDIVGYVFELSLSDESDRIEGTAHVDARFNESGQSKLRLDLIGASAARDGRGMTVSSVTHEGTDLDFTHEDDVVLIDLGGDVPVGERLVVSVAYSGIPAEGLQIGPNKYGDRTFFSDNWSSRVRNWLPTVDHPYDKAKTEMVVTAPSHYQVASNGNVVETTDLGDGTRLTHYVNPVPTATWLYFLGVARFAVEVAGHYEHVPVETWVYPQDREAGFYDFAEPSDQVLAYYTDLIGPYVYDRLANVVSTATGGGMEAASTPAYSERSDRRWQHVIIHESAHQWFGNAVTEYHWNDVWLSEGFATYYTLLFREHEYGHDDFIAGLENARQRVIDFYAEDFDFQLVRPYIEDLNDVSGLMMYQKGAWILHMLREMLGHDVYDAGIRSYYAEFINSNAQTADLRGHLERASGMDLRSYFDQWLFQGGIPRLAVTWSAESGFVRAQLAQTQPTYSFDIPVEIRFHLADGSHRDAVVELSGMEEALVSEEFDSPVERVEIDPNTRLLAEWTVERR